MHADARNLFALSKSTSLWRACLVTVCALRCFLPTGPNLNHVHRFTDVRNPRPHPAKLRLSSIVLALFKVNRFRAMIKREWKEAKELLNRSPKLRDWWVLFATRRATSLLIAPLCRFAFIFKVSHQGRRVHLRVFWSVVIRLYKGGLLER